MPRLSGLLQERGSRTRRSGGWLGRTPDRSRRPELDLDSTVPTLRMEAGPLAGHQFEVESELVVGRTSADIVIDDPELSRQHAIVRLVDGVLQIEDLRSLNGTWVNGERINDVTPLHAGDVVAVGGTTIVVERDAAVSMETVLAPQRGPGQPAASPPSPDGIEMAAEPQAQPVSASNETPVGRPARPRQSRLPDSAAGDELRPVTALFADIVGSTALGEQLSPDEVKVVIGECVTRMCQAVEQFGGKVQALMGDGIAVYFGVPVAHEDDPERAARGALRILEVVAEYSYEVEAAWGISDFNARVGINTGVMAVGLVGASDPQSVSLGDTTNVAARLQSAAEPGTVVVGEATAKSVLPHFVLEALGEFSVKGRVQPVPAWRLVGAQAATEPYQRGPLVARGPEMARLTSIVEELTAGRGQLALIVGDAGLGKTRLLAEVRALAAGRVTWLEGQCLSYGAELLYGPFIEMLRKWIGAEEGQAEIAVRTKLRATLGLLPASQVQEVLPCLARLLGVKLDEADDERLGRLPPDDLAAEIHHAYGTWLTALAARGPVVVAIEDFHWIDPSSRELAGGLLGLADASPILFVGTSRVDPESEGWKLRVHVLANFAHRTAELNLSPLSDDEAQDLLALHAQSAALSQIELEQIVSGAEGNPLYLEELLSAFSDGRASPRGGTWATKTVRVLTPTLESLLVARIDRLPLEARKLAQMAAIVGRSFPLRILEHVAETENLEDELAILLRADIVREFSRYPEPEYVFRHGLLRTASLSTLTPARRRLLYGTVGHAFETLFADSLDDRLEVLANYFARSDDLWKALDYLERAGTRAESLDAMERAVDLWRQAEGLADRLGDVAAQQRLRSRLDSLGGRVG